ncbi:MAG: diaminopimelate epimerase [Burkholderiaceae bacterium]|nr:diaminopimelate epimerase [Burkholderiaceae bacterium]
MRLAFTKMQGAGNDFVVIDATRAPLELTAPQWQRIADRRFGVGADQILLVQAADGPDVDFVYRIFNADGQEVEQCGNGARCFARFVRDKGLTDKTTIRVRTRCGVIMPTIHTDHTITVDMGAPRLTPADVGFDSAGLPYRREHQADSWQMTPPDQPGFWLTVVSMGNPHAVQWVDRLAQHPVAEVGAWCESHPRFKHRVNVGFVEQESDTAISIRVFERGAGETLACGTGACAAVVAGILRGALRPSKPIRVQTRGGLLTIQWSGQAHDHVMMTGPAEPVFDGVMEL